MQDADTVLPQPTEFEVELQRLINRHCIENGSNTPDFLLAQYLMRCLATWEYCVERREEWYGKKMVPAQIDGSGAGITDD